MSEIVYITRYTDANRVPSDPSQPVPAASLQAARAMMFPGVPVLQEFKHLIVFDLGGGQRLALSSRSFT